MLTIAVIASASACGGGSDDATPTTSPVTSATTEPETTNASTTTETTTTTTVAPTTTIDEATILAEAEAAYLEAFEVGKDVFRDPLNPRNESRLRELYVGPNLESALEDLRQTIGGGFVAVENAANPSFAAIVAPAEFVDGNPTEARLTVCEFNSDRIFEVGTAPNGEDALRRDYPVSLLVTVRMEFVDGNWMTRSGTAGEEVRDETERCSEEAA